MTKGALQDLTTCLHYSDDWEPKENGVWDDTYDDPKVVAPPSTASHRLKHGRLEDGYNKRWQAIVNFESGLQLMRVELQAGITVS
jgi:hypothetical protein